MQRPGLASFLLGIVFVVIMTMLFVDMMTAALERLGLTPAGAGVALLGIFLGSAIHVPIWSVARPNDQSPPAPRVLGVPPMPPAVGQAQDRTIIAVNVGGCLIPCYLAIVQWMHVRAERPDIIPIMVGITILSTLVCNRLAIPIPGRGIAMPALIPPIATALLTLAFVPSPVAPSVAFFAGTLGPLCGADLLNLRVISRLNTPLASIGGAGTFDGIVLSGFIATLLA
ncbi:MAG: DUF1614 domain-containing protein [Planctomycetota bacterium]